MRADVVKHSASNPGQIYEVPARQVRDGAGNAFIKLASKTTDWQNENELFTSIINERGLSLDAMELPEPNRNTGAMRFLLALRQCQRRQEPLDARYTQVLPKEEFAKMIDYASLSAAPNAADFLPPHILEQYKPKPTAVAEWGNGNGPETHPELFQQESREAVFVRQQDAAERADQLAEAELQRRREESNALLDAAAQQPQPPAQTQTSWRDASAEVNW